MKIDTLLTGLLSAALLLGAHTTLSAPRESLSLTNDWQATYCEAITDSLDSATWGTYPNAPDGHPWWGSVKFSQRDFQLEKHSDAYNGLWLKKKQLIPAEWSGRRVHFELPVPIRRCDAVLFINDTRAGDILRPGGALDVTRFVRFGEENEFTLFLTQDGSGTTRGVTTVNRWDNGLARGLMSFPRLFTTDAAFVTDVFANPSVQKRQLTLEIEVDSATETPAQLEARILDPEGAVVHTLSEPVSLKKGLNTLAPTIDWQNPHFWDFGDGYLYRCEVSLSSASGLADTYTPFNFGFRELWRDGRELYMNGRPLHMRTCYSYRAHKPSTMQFLQDIGYTVIAFSHEYNGFPNSPERYPDLLDNADAVGMGLILSTGAILNLVDDSLADTPATQQTFREYVRHIHRKFRNHPSFVASYMSQMIICNIADFVPDRIGQTVGDAVRDKVINKAREIHREFNPNILYYSHADGPNGDISSGNLYFNWTPQQEIDEWFSEWSKKGIYPWHGAEFELPYGGAWWYGGGFAMTEFLAATYGERAFHEEPIRALDTIRELSAVNHINGHGRSARTYPHYTSLPMYWVWRKMAVQNINRYWRGYGLNGGLIWFNLDDSYGWPKNELGQCPRTSTAALEYEPREYTKGVRPSWANAAYDIFKPVLQDFSGYLAGTPDQADKTHAFYAGETVDKQAAFIWDGHVAKEFSASWSVCLAEAATPFAKGDISRTLKPGEIAFEPISFQAPAVRQKTAATLTLSYSDGSTHTLELEFYPRPSTDPIALPAGTTLAVYDPAGQDAALLRTLGIPFTTIDSLDSLGAATHLLIGRNALTKSNLPIAPEQLAKGLKILVMAQTPTVWRSLGFKVQDTLSRTVFLRDSASPALATLTDDMLAHWRGAPEYAAKPYSRLMEHTAQRGPAGSRRHIVAGLMLQVPDKAGYLPLIDGGYDFNFAALMRFAYGTGSLTTCTLELQNRVGSDPAATEVARAIVTDFLAPTTPDATRAVACEGDSATALLASIGIAPTTASAAADAASILVVSRDSATDWPTLRARAEAGATILAYNHTALAQAAGFTTAPRQFFRAPRGESPLFRAFTPSLLRWRDVLKADAFTAAPAGATLYSEGLLAELPIGKGRIVFCQVDPLQLGQRFASAPAPEALAADNDFLYGIFRGILTTLGAPATPEDPAADFHGLQANYWDEEAKSLVEKCGAPRHGRKPSILIAGVEKNSNSLGFLRRRAEEGQTVLIVDNPLLADEAGFEVSQRELLSSLDAATFGLPAATHTFALDRSVYRLLKAPDGYTISADGLLAQAPCGKGRIVFLQINPREFEKLGETRERMQLSNDISSERSRQLYARLLTNLGAAPDPTLAARSLYLAPLNPFAPLPSAYVLGPFITNRDEGEYQMNTIFSEEAEKMAIAGDFNPNIEIPLPQGGTANWRPTLAPDASGAYDFSKLFPGAAFPVHYAIVHVNRREAGPARLKVGVDWRVTVWCNGEQVFRTLDGAHFPKYEIELNLKKGDNAIAFKAGAGRAGSKLWALLTSEPDPNAAPRIPNPELDGIPLYAPTLNRTDPYQFFYW